MTDGVEKKTYSAKQVASRIGTDAKQLRKFLRDPNSGYKPVGQGGRYDFPEADLPAIKTAFDAWDATKVRRNRQSSAEKKLATSAGLIPGQRKQSPGTDTPSRPRRQTPEQLFKQGLHGNALDEDNFSARTLGMKERVRRHGLVPNQQGRLVEPPEHIRRAREAKPVELDFSMTSDGKEAELDRMYSEIFDISDEDAEELDLEELEEEN